MCIVIRFDSDHYETKNERVTYVGMEDALNAW